MASRSDSGRSGPRAESSAVDLEAAGLEVLREIKAVGHHSSHETADRISWHQLSRNGGQTGRTDTC